MTALLWIVTLLAALIVGSFLNVVIYRGPALWGLIDDDAAPRGNLALPGSYCPACRTPLKPMQLIPLVSYFALGGKCAACGAPIPARYPLVEFTAFLIAAISIAVFGFSLAGLFAAIFGFILLTLGVIDLETSYLPDALSLPLTLIGVSAALLGATGVAPLESIIGALAGYLSFWALGAGYKKLRGVEGLGLGDAKLVGALGAWTGWQGLPFIVFLGALATLAVVSTASLAGRKADAHTEIPFGPGLCVAGYGVFLGSVWLS